jgi:hypothetical protein
MADSQPLKRGHVRCCVCKQQIQLRQLHKHWAHTPGHRTNATPYPPEDMDLDIVNESRPSKLSGDGHVEDLITTDAWYDEPAEEAGVPPIMVIDCAGTLSPHHR